MTHKQQVSVIREAFYALPDMADGWFDVRQRLFDMNKAAEKQHRSGGSLGLSNGLSIIDAAKYFVVRHLLDGWRETDRFTVDDILAIRNEVLYAQAYANLQRDFPRLRRFDGCKP